MERVELYQLCPICGGKAVWPAGVKGQRGEDLGGTGCPCASSKTPGFVLTGITLGQVDAIIRDRNRLLLFAAHVVRADCIIVPDAVGGPDRATDLTLAAHDLTKDRSAEIETVREIESRDPGGRTR